MDDDSPTGNDMVTIFLFDGVPPNRETDTRLDREAGRHAAPSGQAGTWDPTSELKHQRLRMFSATSIASRAPSI